MAYKIAEKGKKKAKIPLKACVCKKKAVLLHAFLR